MMRRTLFTALALLTLAGCATSFTGSAHIEGGRSGCESKCAGQGLAMSGMVYMGEYSSACVCEVPGASSAAGGPASVAGGAAGVVMQMRQQQQQQQQQAIYGY
ncbi:MAG: lipoprotein [Myxococcales bacterium]|nr:lipoprotein [Myxococcales bacterium]